MAQSAFQALQQEDDVPMYTVNTSDEEEGSSDNATQVLATPLQTTQSTPVPISFSLFQPQQESRYVSSKFSPNDDNTIYNDKYVIFGLKTNQNILIRGQFTLEIQKGAIEINGVVYHSSTPAMTFLNPLSNALPLIQATQVLDSSKLSNNETTENKHFFTPEYKSVIKVLNLHTGLEGVGRLCPQFKNIFWNFASLSTEDMKTFTEYEEAFTGYTFFPIIKPDNSVSILKTNNWKTEINRIAALYKENNLLKIVVIGGKNCGKSTLIRLLLQQLLATTEDSPLNIMDLDPGQPEYSKPDCISLSKLRELQFGNHLSLTSPASQTNHYIGFSSPKDQPNRYDTLVNDLISQYESDGAMKHESLLVNTPGWIKGYGLSLTKKLIDRLKPTHVIYLNSGSPDLEDLKIPEGTEIIPLLGSFNNSVSKFSSAQLRVFKMLSYFHKKENFKFDFEPLVFTPPLQVSYGKQGIRAVTILGESGIDPAKTVEAIEATVVAIYSIKRTLLDTLSPKDTSLPFIDENSFKVGSSDGFFKGLGIVHSVDTQRMLMNIYVPESENLSKPTDHEFILIRGKSELPIWELASNEISKKFGKGNLPFVSYEKLSDYDKTWKVRKNVQRRGQNA